MTVARDMAGFVMARIHAGLPSQSIEYAQMLISGTIAKFSGSNPEASMQVICNFREAKNVSELIALLR